jgi:hypothetical protein
MTVQSPIFITSAEGGSLSLVIIPDDTGECRLDGSVAFISNTKDRTNRQIPHKASAQTAKKPKRANTSLCRLTAPTRVADNRLSLADEFT